MSVAFFIGVVGYPIAIKLGKQENAPFWEVFLLENAPFLMLFLWENAPKSKKSVIFAALNIMVIKKICCTERLRNE